VWQINAVFTFKSIIITSSHSHKKHSVYQFSPSLTATWWKSETIIKENWQLSCLLTIAEDFCITVWQIVYIFRQKSKQLQMCHHSWKRPSLPVFTQSYYTPKIFKRIDNSAVCWHVQIISSSQCHKLCTVSDKNSKISCKVSKQSEKIQPTSFHTGLHGWNFQKINNLTICWCFQMISLSQCHKLCMLSHKNENVC